MKPPPSTWMNIWRIFFHVFLSKLKNELRIGHNLLFFTICHCNLPSWWFPNLKRGPGMGGIPVVVVVVGCGGGGGGGCTVVPPGQSNTSNLQLFDALRAWASLQTMVAQLTTGPRCFFECNCFFGTMIFSQYIETLGMALIIYFWYLGASSNSIYLHFPLNLYSTHLDKKLLP